MRLITFTPKTAPTSTPRAGALLPGDDSVLNFSVAVDASADVPLLSWFDLDDEWLPKVRQIHDALARNVARTETLPRGSVLRRDDVVIGPPVPRPGKLICVGLNYRDHAAESGMDVPTSPITFSKYVTSVTGPGQPIRLPAVSTQVDYEAELAFVVGRRAKHVPVAQAFDYVLGYMNLNDVSARDLQFADKQWQRGKSCDTFAPMGPFIVTPRRHRRSARPADPVSRQWPDTAGLEHQSARLRRRQAPVVPQRDCHARARRRRAPRALRLVSASPASRRFS